MNDQFFSSISSNQFEIPDAIHYCPSIESECYHALTLAHEYSQTYPISIVVPHSDYKQLITSMAFQRSIPIKTPHNSTISKTCIGGFLLLLIDWAQSKDIQCLYELSLQPVLADQPNIHNLQNFINNCIGIYNFATNNI